MPEDEHTDDSGSIFSGYGIASAVLGLVSVFAVVLAVMIWSGHRTDVDERRHQTRVLQAAADWTGVLINMNKDTVDASLQKLHEGTVGELNTEFDSALEPFKKVIQKLESRTTGQVDSVAVEAIHHRPQNTADGAPAPATAPQPALSAMAKRTDTVMVVATSVSENVGGKPQAVRWNLRLDVSEVEGKLLISRLEPFR
jgi:hypothetical protein